MRASREILLSAERKQSENVTTVTLNDAAALLTLCRSIQADNEPRPVASGIYISQQSTTGLSLAAPTGIFQTFALRHSLRRRFDDVSHNSVSPDWTKETPSIDERMQVMYPGGGSVPSHRSVASIRSTATIPGQLGSSPTPPRSPRALSGSYGSASGIRADDDFILVELGSRFIRVGFAGDSLPKASLGCGPEQQHRVGDYREWLQHGPAAGDNWASDYEIWRPDLREFDLGLFQDRLDRMLRDALTRHLLIDSRPRRMGLILDPGVSMPLLSATLDTLFSSFQTPVVSLMSSPTLTAVAAGVRCALVVDMGWIETVVTSVYEYREVKTTRTVRGGKLLLDRLYGLLHSLLADKEANEGDKRVVSFLECEDILCRLMWCRASDVKSSPRQSAHLDTVQEQDESEAETTHFNSVAEIPLRSSAPLRVLRVPFGKLADVCDEALFDLTASPSSFDDHELPIHLLVYHHLLHLPVDVRAVCMSRLIFTGGSSEILGIKERVLDEVSSIVGRRGWVPVTGRAFDQLRHGTKLRRESVQRLSVSSTTASSESSIDDHDGALSDMSATETIQDNIEAKILRNRPVPQQMQGQLRAIHSLGPWAGASLMCHLKLPALATVEREPWQQQGASGAFRPSEVDIKAQQRYSTDTGGVIRGGSAHHHMNWTLGIWGTL